MGKKGEKAVEQAEEKSEDKSTETTASAEGESTAQVLLRGAYMVLFVIITRLAEFVIAGAALVQLGYKLATKKPNDRVTAFGDSLTQFVAQIVRFQTFNSEEKPFPFQAWPTPATAKAADEQSSTTDTDSTEKTQAA